MNDKKTHAAINNNKFKELGHIGDQLCQVELAKYEIELKESIIAGFFILECSKLRKLKLFCNFVTKLYDIDNFEKMGMNTDSLYFALAEKEMSDCIQKEKTRVGSFCVAKTVKTRSLQALVSVFPLTCSANQKKYDKKEPELFEKEFRRSEMLSLCSRTHSVTTL